MKTEIHLIRHPDTGINTNRQKPGDVPAEEENKRLHLLADKLEPLEPEIFLTSDFERARLAAELVTNKLGRLDDLIVTHKLREVLIWPDIQNLGTHDSEEERERVREVLEYTRDETFSIIEEIVYKYLREGEDICMFTHGNLIRCIITKLGGAAIEDMMHLEVDHLSITTIVLDTETSMFTLLRVNDTLKTA